MCKNNATRFLTNAKVVILCQGTDTNPNLPQTVLNLTAEHKAGLGPGVTSSDIVVATQSQTLATLAQSLGLTLQQTSSTRMFRWGVAVALVTVGNTRNGPRTFGSLQCILQHLGKQSGGCRKKNVNKHFDNRISGDPLRFSDRSTLLSTIK